MKPESIGFFATLTAAFFLSRLPIVHIPFDWMATFYHEISHGIAAVLTGGRAVSFKLLPGGSGVCYTAGGWRPLVLLAGYAGTTAAGAAMYLTADRLPAKRSDEIAWALIVMLAVSAAMLGRDLLTLLLIGGMIILLLTVIRIRSNNAVRMLVKISGLYVLLQALEAPLTLLGNRHRGDGARLADITHIPELFWALAWAALGIFALWRIGRVK